MRAAFLPVVFVAAGLFLATAQADNSEVLKVGVHDKPPYALKQEDGTWGGIGIELWQSVASLTGIRIEFVEMPYADILPAVRSGKLDAGVGEFDITADSARGIEFSPPFLHSSIGVAVKSGTWTFDWFEVISGFLNWSFMQVILLILGGMLLVSFLIWVLERHHRCGHFKGGVQGFGSALWFAAVTMTTVGYGDKTPSTFVGRLIAFFWMLAGVLLVASFTGAVASSVATARVNGIVGRTEDLRHLSVAVVQGSESANVLSRRGIAFKTLPDIEAAVEALAEKRVQAVASDRVSLAYLITHHRPDGTPLPITLTALSLQDALVAIPMRPGLPRRDDINVAILQTVESSGWQAVRLRWLGGIDSGN